LLFVHQTHQNGSFPYAGFNFFLYQNKKLELQR
jgi:hypothetical protein